MVIICVIRVAFVCYIIIIFMIQLLMVIINMVNPETTPPNVTCDDVTTKPFLPNSFLGLDVGVTYTYEDLNPDPSGVTYNVTTGSDGDLFPPGRTPVTMYAVDIFLNRATCLFYVENTRKYRNGLTAHEQRLSPPLCIKFGKNKQSRVLRT